MLPKQSNPTEYRVDNRGRKIRAVAPYNFVPLPEKIAVVETDEVRHDRYTDYTGYIRCTLRTHTPLYVRGAMDPDRFREWGDKIREMMERDALREEYARFFHIEDVESPVIPGSSLRGMTRSLVEIVGFGKMPWVTDKKLFFRSMDNAAIGDYYRDRMTDKVEGGILRESGHRYYIQKWKTVRVHRDKLFDGNHFVLEDLYDGPNMPNFHPKWAESAGTPSQYCEIWVTVSANGNYVDELSYEQKDGFQKGILVITGNMGKLGRPRSKKKEFVFLEPTTPPQEIDVPAEIMRRFHDDDQITQWQQDAFPVEEPTENGRERKGMLRKDHLLAEEGDPVFFLREGGQLTFFGRAQMFRLPYERSPLDFVPVEQRRHVDGDGDGVYDLAESIFGYAPEGERKGSLAGRVYFGDAHCLTKNANAWLVTPEILASPKPTTFQHYLVQDGQRRPEGDDDELHDPANKDELAHYGTVTPRETVVRGHKLYWHKQESGSVTKKTIQSRRPVYNWKKDSQHTQIRPVKAGVEFEFCIYFENLRDFELGALLWSLKPPSGPDGDPCMHKLGMGKPLGLGTVVLDPVLTLSDRHERYKTLFAAEQWHTPNEQDTQTIEEFKHQFEEHFLQKLYPDHNVRPASLTEIERVKMLLQLMQWPGPADELTRYMTIQARDEQGRYNEYAQRPVLPDPLHIADELKMPGGRQQRRPTRGRRQWSDQPRHDPRGNVPQPPPPTPRPKPRPSPPPEHKPGEQGKAIAAAAAAQILGAATENPLPPSSEAPDGPVAVSPATIGEIEKGMYVNASVVRTTFNSVVFDVGDAGIDGTLSDTHIVPPITSTEDLKERFLTGDQKQLWVRGINKKGRVQLSMKKPGK